MKSTNQTKESLDDFFERIKKENGGAYPTVPSTGQLFNKEYFLKLQEIGDKNLGEYLRKKGIKRPS